MVTYIKSDLEFILAQIKIAEAHARWLANPADPLGKPLFGPNGSIPTYNLSWGLRTVDGSENNPLHPEWGSSDNPFPERLGTVFRPADGTSVDFDGPGGQPPIPTQANYNPSNNPNSIVVDGSVRTISNLLVDMSLGNPAAILTALQRAGIVAPDQEMTVTNQISAAYAPLKPLFEDLVDAERAYATASASASANPGNAALQAAAAAAQADVAAAAAALDAVDDALMALLGQYGVELSGANIVILNQAPDEGLSAPFNSWFTLFGQFFDHGLDLVGKGGSGTVFIPLQPDDPLYDPTSSTNFMVLTRATVGAGVDGVMNTADDVRPVNTTTAFVDQNQTYTSHPSHQVFLREYVLRGGDPFATGKLIEGSNGGMATWANLKTQAADLLGIQLLDANVGNVPLLATDPYGNMIRGPNGFPQIVTTTGLVEGNPAADGGNGVLLPPNTIFTGHAFLADIAHNAVPEGLADGDIEVGLGNNDPTATPGYDNELLDAHFIAGDGRANENIGLTAVHHVFHSEHNRLAEHTKAVTVADAQAMLASGSTPAQAVAFLNEWLAVDVVAVPTTPAQIAALVWDGERLFQAAKFGTEMQYQHLVFEEFARKIQPNINAFIVPDGYDVTIDASIVAEFAHVVYRFGHSMLTETIDRFDPTFTEDQIGLIEGFLNPLQFQNNGTNATVDADIAAGAIIRGMTRQVGNEIDEFVTGALRNNLLGLPLDLATINLARGRDTGVPSLNEARAQFYEATSENVLLKPYESWVDFASHLKHEASIINFVAAYGTHPLITGEPTIEGKRDAALTIITGVSTGGLLVPGDATDFLNATGSWAGGSLGGLNNVDLWIGGLAEEIMPFGGMLGSTFNFVFETQMESLQNGDRFYYLQRLDGLHLFGEMEANSFAAMIMRNTNATHLPSDVFSAPGLILEVNKTLQYNANTGVFLPGLDGILGDDPLTVGVDESLDDVMDTNADPVGSGILTQVVSRNNPATPGVDSNYLRYTGGDHVVLGGTGGADIMIAGIGDDTIHGDGGNDRVQGGFGNDIINGGAGDDIITDSGGDDNVKGGDGHDAVHGGPGLDLVLGGAGQDFVVLGTDDLGEVFGGEGNDFISASPGAERILGNEGDDWLEGGAFSGAPGDNFDEIFARDSIRGNDVFIGTGGFDEYIGEGGDDIMVGSTGRNKTAGMSGFDWVTYKDNATGVNADLSIPIIFDEAPVFPQNTILDEFESVEGLSGSQFNDVLRGTNLSTADRLPIAQGGTEGFQGSALDVRGIALINGLQAVLGAGVTSYSAGDLILGGDGNDLITGLGGDDVIDGDKWLDVQIGVFAPGDTNHTGAPISLHNNMASLANAIFAGTINPGQLSIVRTIRTANGTGDIDTAVFSDVRENYTITYNADGSVSVAHVDGTQADGTDKLWNVERAQFTNALVALNNVAATGAPAISDQTPTEGQALTATAGTIADGNGLGPISYQWQSSVNGTTWNNIAGATNASFTPDDNAGMTFGDQAGLLLRVVASFTDGGGTAEQRISAATGPVGVNWLGDGNGNSLVGTEGDDIGNGQGGNDILRGNGGADLLQGMAGNDVLIGGAGNDRLEGGVGASDIAQYAGAAGAVSNFSFGNVSGDDLIIIDNTGVSGTDTLDRVEILQFNGVNYTVVNGTNAGDGSLNGAAGAAGSQAVFGFGGNDTMNGGAGNDLMNGNAGNDTITQTGGTGGRDRVDGGLGNDTWQLNGVAGAETFRIYTRAEAVLAGMTGLATTTEIVVTRNGTNNASIIAELDNIEEININALNVTSPGAGGNAGGGDTVQVIGNFNSTSLNFNTITIAGSTGQDTIDITGLQSDHRVVFTSNGGADSVIGVPRPQDIFDGVFAGGGSNGIGGSGGLVTPPVAQITELPEAFAGGPRWLDRFDDFDFQSDLFGGGMRFGPVKLLSMFEDDHDFVLPARLGGRLMNPSASIALVNESDLQPIGLRAEPGAPWKHFSLDDGGFDFDFDSDFEPMLPFRDDYML